MKLIHKVDKIVPGIKTFFRMYLNYHSQNAPFYTERRYNRMKTLDLASCTVAQFNDAMEVTHWLDNRCDECDGDFDTVVQLGQEPDYESKTVEICMDCLVKSIQLLKE